MNNYDVHLLVVDALLRMDDENEISAQAYDSIAKSIEEFMGQQASWINGRQVKIVIDLIPITSPFDMFSRATQNHFCLSVVETDDSSSSSSSPSRQVPLRRWLYLDTAVHGLNMLACVLFPFFPAAGEATLSLTFLIALWRAVFLFSGYLSRYLNDVTNASRSFRLRGAVQACIGFGVFPHL